MQADTQEREGLLRQFAGIVNRNAQYLGATAANLRMRGIAGPRAGALEVSAGAQTGAVLRALTRDDAALLRQLVPWDFGGNRPNAFMSGRYLRLDAPWPDALAETDVPLRSLGRHPDGAGRWIAGKNESGDTITLGFNLDRTPHWLFSGTSGSGKTVAVRTALVQLARDPRNRFILVDGKRGLSLRSLAHLNGRIGPLATTPADWKAALLWANGEMNRRFSEGYETRMIVVVEEIQEVIADPACAEIVARLVTLGREVETHCLLTTQHPTVKSLGGPRVARNLAGRLALKVTDDVASRVAVGSSSPRADYLLGRGDGYAVSVDTVHRAQMALPDEQDVADASGGDATNVVEWESAEVDDLGDAPKSAHRQADALTPTEVGMILVAASMEMGRRKFQEYAVEITGTKPGSDKADRLLALGRQSLDWLTVNGYQVTEL